MPKCHTQRLSQRSGVCTSIASASQVVEDSQLRHAGCALRRGVCQKGLRLRRAQLPRGFFFEKKNLEAKLHGKVKLGFSNLKISKIIPIWTKFPHQTLSPPQKKRLHPIFFSEPVDCAKDFSVISKPLTYFDSYGSAAVTGSEATSPWWFQVTNYRHGNRLHAF